MSDDGRNGITVIAFIGSVFSPYYAWARRKGIADPLEHCAINIGLYGANSKRWAMTERGRRHVHRESSALAIGPSSVTWAGDKLVIDIDEVAAPFPSRICGRVTLYPSALIDHDVALDAAHIHHWQPIAPCARVEVEMSQPKLKWSGTGYLDSNRGSAPLEAGFARWDWSRAELPNGESVVLYDVERRSGEQFVLAQRFSANGTIENIVPPPTAALPASAWRVARGTRSDHGHIATIKRSLEDGPFYARSVVNSHLLGQRVTGVHESLSLDRFQSPWVQMLLPFRMPRRA